LQEDSGGAVQRAMLTDYSFSYSEKVLSFVYALGGCALAVANPVKLCSEQWHRRTIGGFGPLPPPLPRQSDCGWLLARIG